MNIKNTVVSLLVGVVLLGVAVAVVTVGKPTVNVNVPESQPVKVGSVAGPDLWFRVTNFNGVQEWNESRDMYTATTTLCSFMSPSATTSLQFVSFLITTGTSTAATIDIGTSTTAYSTTTNLVSAKSIASGAQGYVEWMPVGGSVDDNTLAPNTYVVVKTAGAGLGGYKYGGKCKVRGTILGQGLF